MKRAKILAAGWAVGVLVGGLMLTNGAAMAASCNGVETAMLSCAEGESGIGAILALVINILSGGVVILALAGIVLSGMQHLRAGDNVGQAQMARRRIAEIVIGLGIYALMYVGLQWLIPGGVFDPNEIPYYAADEAGYTVSYGRSERSGATGVTNSTVGDLSLNGNYSNFNSASPIANTAVKFAWPIGDEHNLITNTISHADGGLVFVPTTAYKTALMQWATTGIGAVSNAVVASNSNIFGQGASCDVFVGTVVRDVTGDTNYPFRGPGTMASYMAQSADWEEIDYGDDVTKLQPGDVMTRSSDGVYGHAQIFVGLNDAGQAIIAQAQHEAATGYLTNGTADGGLGTYTSGYRVFRYKK